MRRKTVWLAAAVFTFLPTVISLAQDNTSRLVPFSLSSSLPPGTTQDVVVELWDAASGGALVFNESYVGDAALVVDDDGNISFLFGSLQVPPGLNPSAFPSGSSRYLDVTQQGVSVLSARLPLMAVAFALSAPSDFTGNLTMVDSTPTAGNVLKGGALFLHNFGSNNTFLGANAGNLTTSGTGRNTAIGAFALFSNTTGVNNTASGANALYSNRSGNENTASGANALYTNTTGSQNTASGFGALNANTAGSYDTASGFGALVSNTTGSWNTASGVAALAGNTSGGRNTASGANALSANTTGSENTASGTNALRNNTTGNYNTASGANALYYTTGDWNTASGANALVANTTGIENTASGINALRNNATGSGNSALGSGADVSVGSLNNATAIGYNAVVNASNKVRVGNTNVTVIEGQVGFTASSDVHQKENFRPVDGEDVLGKIRGLKLTSWNFIGHDPKHFRHYGPMAQDFFAAFGHDSIGTVGTDTTITSTDMDGILMIAAQALERRTVKQQNRIARHDKRVLELEKGKVEQSRRIDALRAENAELKARLEALERRMGNAALTRAE